MNYNVNRLTILHYNLTELQCQAFFCNSVTFLEVVMSLSERLKQIRLYYGISQKEFADSLGITHAHISKLENDKGIPSETLKNLLCERYNISLDWLNNGHGDMHIQNDGLALKPKNIMPLLEGIFSLLTEDKDITYNGAECMLALLSIVDSSKNIDITKKTLRMLTDTLYMYLDYITALQFDCPQEDKEYLSSFFDTENKKKQKHLLSLFSDYSKEIAKTLKIEF